MSSRAAAGFWAVATIYVVIGIIGVVFLGNQSDITGSAGGYGAFTPAAAK